MSVEGSMRTNVKNWSGRQWHFIILLLFYLKNDLGDSRNRIKELLGWI